MLISGRDGSAHDERIHRAKADRATYCHWVAPEKPEVRGEEEMVTEKGKKADGRIGRRNKQHHWKAAGNNENCMTGNVNIRRVKEEQREECMSRNMNSTKEQWKENKGLVGTKRGMHRQ